MTGPGPQPIAATTRTDLRSGRAVVESRHVGTLVVVGPDGEVAASLGDPARPTFARSTVKPFQATACLEILDREGVPTPSADQLAVSWASHRAEEGHRRAVSGLLERSGVPADDLTCPPAPSPASPELAAARLLHNCSGKHALFALAGAALGIDRERILDPDAPLQRTVLAHLEDALGPPTAVAVDGCGAPAVEVPLIRLADAFRRVAVDDRYARVRDSAFAHPQLVGGTGRLESALLAEGVVAKPGAEGVFAASWTDDGRGWALAVKAEDGAGRAAAVATFAALVALGVVEADVWSPEPVMGGGRQQGAVVAAPGIEQLRGPDAP